MHGLPQVYKKALQEKNKERVAQYTKEYKASNRKKFCEIQKRYRQTHPERVNAINRAYEKKNRAAISAARRRRRNERMKTDTQYALRTVLRNRFKSALRDQGATKTVSAISLVGCTIPELKAHLESQFRDSMTWENRGTWHIDHIRPCASFDLSRMSQQKKCFHFTNLQPLWAVDNFKKGASWDPDTDVTETDSESEID